jgi:hypothetical protein
MTSIKEFFFSYCFNVIEEKQKNVFKVYYTHQSTNENKFARGCYPLELK